MANSLQSLHGHQPGTPKQKLFSFSFVKLLGFIVQINDLLTTTSPFIPCGDLVRLTTHNGSLQVVV